MLKIGVLGVGHLGKIHLGLLLQLPELFEVVGFYDADQINAGQVATKFNVKSYNVVYLYLYIRLFSNFPVVAF